MNFDHNGFKVGNSGLGGIADALLPTQPIQVAATVAVEQTTRDWVDRALSGAALAAVVIPLLLALVNRYAKPTR